MNGYLRGILGVFCWSTMTLAASGTISSDVKGGSFPQAKMVPSPTQVSLKTVQEAIGWELERLLRLGQAGTVKFPKEMQALKERLIKALQAKQAKRDKSKKQEKMELTVEELKELLNDRALSRETLNELLGMLRVQNETLRWGGDFARNVGRMAEEAVTGLKSFVGGELASRYANLDQKSPQQLAQILGELKGVTSSVKGEQREFDFAQDTARDDEYEREVRKQFSLPRPSSQTAVDFTPATPTDPGSFPSLDSMGGIEGGPKRAGTIAGARQFPTGYRATQPIQIPNGLRLPSGQIQSDGSGSSPLPDEKLTQQDWGALQKANKGDVSLPMMTTYSNSPDSQSACQITINDRRTPTRGDGMCSYTGNTALHCVTQENGVLTSLAIGPWGQLGSPTLFRRDLNGQSVSLGGSKEPIAAAINHGPVVELNGNGYDVAMIHFKAPCKGPTEVPVVPVLPEGYVGNEPVLVDGRRMYAGLTSNMGNGNLRMLHVENGIIVPGNSGGAVLDSQGYWTGAISSVVTESPDYVLFATDDALNWARQGLNQFAAPPQLASTDPFGAGRTHR